MNNAVFSKSGLKDYLNQHNIINLDRTPYWWQGMFLGNGDTLVTAYHTDGFTYGINKVDVWDRRGEPDKHPVLTRKKILALLAGKKYAELFKLQWKSEEFCNGSRKGGTCLMCRPPSQKPCGFVKFSERFSSAVSDLTGTDFNENLDIYGAELHSSCTINGRQQLSCFVDANSNVIVFDWQRNNCQRETVCVDFIRETDEDLGTPEFGAEKNGGWMRYRFPDGFVYAVYLAAAGKSFATSVVGDKVRLVFSKEYAGRISVCCAVATSLESRDPLKHARLLAESAVARGSAAVRRGHQKWWSDFWSKSFLSIDDKHVENLWYYSYYLMASCSRGSQPPFEVTPWWLNDYQLFHSGYWSNVNIQEVYWLIYTGNHLELGKPMFDLYHRLLPQIRKETRKYYDTGGIKFPFAMDNYGREIMGGYWLFEVYVTAWVAQMYWWKYLYTMDHDFLANVAYPILKGVADFYLEFLYREKNGKLSIWPSHIVETQGATQGTNEVSYAKNGAIEVAFAKEAFQMAIKASEILKKDEANRDKWRDALAHLPQLPIAANKILQYEGAPADLPARHPDRLAPIFPCGQIGLSSPAKLQKIASRTIQSFLKNCSRRPKNMPFGLPGGFYIHWVIPALARLGMADLARLILCDVHMLCYTKRNGFHEFKWGFPDDGPQPQRPYAWGELDETVSFASSLNEMLIQSYDGVIRIFPAWPRDWKNVCFRDFRTVGAFLVTAVMQAGQVAHFSIKSEAGQKCTLINPWQSRAIVVTDKAGGKVPWAYEADNKISFHTRKGHVYFINRVGQSGKYKFNPVVEKRDGPRVYVGPKYHKTSRGKQVAQWQSYLGRPRGGLFKSC